MDSIFRHFDTQGKGYITMDEFVKAFEMPISLDTTIKIFEKDIIQPLITRLKTLGFYDDLETVYTKFRHQNSRMTTNDFAGFLATMLKVQLLPQEKDLVQAIFKRFGNVEALEIAGFRELLSTTYIHNKADATLSKNLLKKVKNSDSLKSKRKSLQEILAPFDKEKTNRLCLRNLKLALFQEFHLSQSEIEILIDHLAKDQSGYVSIEEFNSMLIQAI